MQKTLRKPKALLIDDEPDIVNLCKELLEGMGMDVLTTSNGFFAFIESCTNYEKAQFEIIVTDLSMPMLTGEEFLKELVFTENLNRKTPVLILSGFIDDEIKKKFQPYSHIRFMDKPFMVAPFIAKVNELLKLSPSYQLLQGTSGASGSTE